MQAQELDPDNPFVLGLYVEVLLKAEQCQEAIFYHEKALSIDPDHPFISGGLINAYLCLGDYERSFKEWKRLNYDIWEKYGITEKVERIFYENGWIAFMRELITINEGVMAEEIKDRLPNVLFEKYFLVGEYDKAVDNLEIMYHANTRNPNYPYYSAKKYYRKLKDDPRYLEILKKMNLPVSDN